MGSAQSCLPRPQQITAQKPAAKASFVQGADKRERFVVLVGPGKQPATRAVEPEHGDPVQEAPKKQAAKQQGAEKPERFVVLVAGGAPRLAAKPPTTPDATQPQVAEQQVAGAKSNTLSASDTPGRQLRRQWKAARQAAVRKCSGQGAGNPERFVVLFAGGKVLQAARAAEPEHGNGDNQAAGQRAAAQQAAEKQAVGKQDAEQRAVEQQVLEQQAAGNQAVQQQAARQHAVDEQAGKEHPVEALVAEGQADAQQAAAQQAVEQQVAEQQTVQQQAAKQQVVEAQVAKQQADGQQDVEYLDAMEQVDEEPLPDEQVTLDAATDEAPVGGGATCCICFDDNLPQESMYFLACQHEYCRDCLRQHVTVAVEDTRMVPRCPQPDCRHEMDVAALRSLLTPEEWTALLDVAAEAGLLAEERLYCPYPSCSALMVKGPDFGKPGVTRCPHCTGKLCGECGKQPHAGADCAAAAAGAHLASDAELLKLAKKENWQQCPVCRSMVERTYGCNFMVCTYRGCCTRFCYQCGKQYRSNDHFSCCNPATGAALLHN